MAAVKKNLLIEQKSTFTFSLFWRTGKNVPVDLTGYSARLMAKDAAGATLFDLSTANGKIVLGAGGSIKCTLTDAETAAMTFSQGGYDLKLTAPGGQGSRLAEGTVTLSMGVTD